MDLEYDLKFEEMKKYIPFLENMIKRLESTNTGSSNPRKAQLDKIKSLRDLLLDKKKKMKMENLLKCEQVLVNLYAKIDQKDTLPGIKKASEVSSPDAQRNDNFNSARNKLKSVATNINNDADTLPEIARASEIEEVCTPGSKEPALFQRRPYKPDLSSCKEKSPQKSKRQYTRVLVSPDKDAAHWSTPKDDPEKPMFSRRSPRRSPRRSSPSYKKERKKFGQSKKSRAKDLNITLNVPEESLGTLSTKDIVSRIINCDDNDVDIDTLRELKANILGELKQTGAREDISDLILKSYKKKKKRNKLNEIEEGELSDSESETIESVYGSLVVVDKSSTKDKTEDTDDSPVADRQRKIQICLVYNTDEKNNQPGKANIDVTDFEMYVDEKTPKSKEDIISKGNTEADTKNSNTDEIANSGGVQASNSTTQEKDALEQNVNSDESITKSNQDESTVNLLSSSNIIFDTTTLSTESGRTENAPVRPDASQFKPNFYKPINDDNYINNAESLKFSSKSKDSEEITKNKEEIDNNSVEFKSPGKSAPLSDDTERVKNLQVQSTGKTNEKESITLKDQDVEIPLLNTEPVVPTPTTKSVVSEIDILQALKNEILNETISIPGTENTTPLLHQPKVAKVARAQEIMNKKRISIEKYKEMSVATTQRPSLYVTDPSLSLTKDELSKKQSRIKLTEKECERFKLPCELALDESSESEDDIDRGYTVEDVYADLAPKSPEINDTPCSSNSPIIIPGEPVKSIVSSKTDIDMRTLPNLSPKVLAPNASPLSPAINKDMKPETKKVSDPVYKPPLVDPRLRDLNKQARIDSANPHITPDRTPRPVTFPNVSSTNPNMTPNRTPNARIFETTSSCQSFEFDDISSRKHVYAPFMNMERERDSSALNEKQKPNWDTNVDRNMRKNQWDAPENRDRDPKAQGQQRETNIDYQRSRNSRNTKYRIDRRDDYSYNRQDCPRTPVHHFGRSDGSSTPTPSFGRKETKGVPSVYSFGRSDCPSTPSHPFGRSDGPNTPIHHFGRSDHPTTPSHPFGRSDGPTTPTHTFGRSDCPTTPSHPFGRSDCPTTPSHPFGRSDCPTTPIHPFGRSDGPTTPSHPFGRSDCPATPNHPFGRSDGSSTPNHSFPSDMIRSDYHHMKVKDPRLNRNSEYDAGNKYNNKDNKSYNLSDSYRRGEPSMGRNDRSFDRNSRQGRVISNDDELFSRDRGRYTKDVRGYSDLNSGRFNRAPSVGKAVTPRRHDENTLSVKPQTGLSFTIDTSVNRTFQEFLDKKGIQIFDYSPSFDARRQRAASVGRALLPEPRVSRSSLDQNVGHFTRAPSVGRHVRESSVGRKPSVKSADINKKFERARSVGRDIAEHRHEKSFTDIKAEFKSYSESFNKHKGNNLQNKIYHYQKKSDSGGSTYSPRKNIRDPRLRRGHYSSLEESNKYRSDNNRNKKNYGIVYSSDNIAKGVILNSGFGVKNYKIPKIKRVVEETPVEEVKITDQKFKVVENNEEKSKIEGSNKKTIERKDQRNEKNIKPSPKPNKTSELKEAIFDKSKQSEEKNKKVTRSQSTSKIVESESLEKEDEIKPKKKKLRGRRGIISSDSDSDADEKLEKNENKPISPITKDNNDTLKPSDKKQSPMKKPTHKEANKKDDHNSSFAIDDIEVFPENLASEQVMNNINALIADLDEDIDKNQQFSTDIALEKMFENINSPEDDPQKQEESLNDLNEFISEEINIPQLTEIQELPITEKQDISKISGVESKPVNAPVDEISNEIVVDKLDQTINQVTHEKEIELIISQNINTEILTKPQSQEMNIQDKQIDEAIVSTSNDGTKEKNCEKTCEQILDRPDRSSTPDSTINATDSVVTAPSEGELPDSSTNDLNSQISSSISALETNIPTDEPSKESITQRPSLEGFLLMLKDKTKIKELISSISSFSDDLIENEKVKKKLEKLRDIVSDDDTNDVPDAKRNNENISEKETVLEDKQASGLIKDQPVNKEEENCVSQENSIDNKSSEKDVMENIEKTEQVDEEKHVTVRNPKRPGKRRKRGKFMKGKKVIPTEGKRVTRSVTSISAQPKPKKQSRELSRLQNDIKEMFISDDVLNATGIRMCRIAKLVGTDDKGANEEQSAAKNEPVVVLQKCKDNEVQDNSTPVTEKVRKKPRPKPKNIASKSAAASTIDKSLQSNVPLKQKPGPKSKTQQHNPIDPYQFDTDSVSEHRTSDVDAPNNSSDSDSERESLASSKSFESSEPLTELKKKIKRKRGRGGWKSGVIKKRKKTEKLEPKHGDMSSDDKILVSQKMYTIPDANCFTDKSYCFLKHVMSYSCRLCPFEGSEIVHHYKSRHPHSEIPLSRMNPVIAREVIEQCEQINFQTLSKTVTDKYVCRFCYKEFVSKRKSNNLEAFFWHVVSTHTGEYKQLCSECINVTRCPFNLDIPPPPKDVKGQLIGYICGKCNFTQISLENLKTHVIVRHNDEQTAVYTINLAVMDKNTISALIKQSEREGRVLRSSRSNVSFTETSDDPSDFTDTDQLSETSSGRRLSSRKTKAIDSPEFKSTLKGNFKSKIVFDDDVSDSSIIKTEKHELNRSFEYTTEPEPVEEAVPDTHVTFEKSTDKPNDVVDFPHFKISRTKSGAEEYVCCINGQDNHYKNSLLISMKKHVQTKHVENWDGYCFVCKLIVTPQGKHSYKECLQHLLDKHIDNFPIMEQAEEQQLEDTPTEKVPQEQVSVPSASTSYINVRPLAELLSKTTALQPSEETEILPQIANVVSLGAASEASVSRAASEEPENIYVEPTTVPVPTSSPALTLTKDQSQKYEETQLEVMKNKHQVVLDTMMSPSNLVRIYKCAGKYCCFTSDDLQDSLLHASTHQRIGGENSLICSYCDFDCAANAIALVTHVFKVHGRCQYACSQCFYRAAASQLVQAHMVRMHGSQAACKTILKTDTVTPGSDDPSDLLPREVAVQHYRCEDEKCTRFKTYTQGKFCDHLHLKHQPPFMCHNCKSSFMDSLELVQHMKSHGLKILQCTWCIFGADNETELLAHASSKHPNKQPQAYLRVITTTKDGTNKMMVLPLAQYNKSLIQTELVPPSTAKDNPVRDAEHAWDLEQLIGSMPTLVPTAEEGSDQTSQIEQDQQIEQTKHIGETDQAEPIESAGETNPEATSEISLPAITPQPSTSMQHNDMAQVSLVKKEPVDDPSPEKMVKHEIINLDSDEEDSITIKPPVIDLSDDDEAELSKEHENDTSATKAIIPLDILYNCSKCGHIYKTLPAFKRHVQAYLLSSTDTMKCAHCPLSFTAREELYMHYEDDHRPYGRLSRELPARLSKIKPAVPSKEPSKAFNCGKCDATFKTQFLAKQHAKTHHSAAGAEAGGPGRAGPKRKLSGGAEPAAAAAAKRRRFGPQDVERLPPKPVLDELVYCALCEFSSKVRTNVVRHLQGHADRQPVAQTAPVNPVPHLETNEKHFDRMVNLASSSVASRAPERRDPAPPAPPAPAVPPELAARYPRFVPERQRHTCGARGCSYISVDEAMLRCHWDTLHAGTNDFHCVHCPPYQHLDTSKALTASRIIAHLKMHDVRLFACSACTYYHYKRQVVEKHLLEMHKDGGRVLVVRSEAAAAAPAAPAPAAPTMDLKPWQCGLCKFKNMLRQEVVEHCSKVHNSKMQYKCPNCPFRTSTLENVTKHLSHSHAKSPDQVIYYYYREGSIPDEPDGQPRWAKQREQMGIIGNPEVKTETDPPPVTSVETLPMVIAASSVDLNIVKTEKEEAKETTDELCKQFGVFCAPNGLKYKCPLCKVVMEASKEAMQSHLFEELKYRKWGCSMCSYKAFHRAGLAGHMVVEHRQNRDPVELPANTRIEKWVTGLLDHQTTLIENTKENFAKQRIIVEKPTLYTPPTKIPTPESSPTFTDEELIKDFGEFGAADGQNMCCPKCDFKSTDEEPMMDHLETELNKIRWRCSVCQAPAQEYHEAQLHSKAVHASRARVVEAPRDPARRTAWRRAVLRTQAPGVVPGTARTTPVPAVDNSLLAVHYEKPVPTPEAEMLRRRAAPADSDDERLVIDEPSAAPNPEKSMKSCPYCLFETRTAAGLHKHLLRHYELKPLTCRLCGEGLHPQAAPRHAQTMHPDAADCFRPTEVPAAPPTINVIRKGRKVATKRDDGPEPPREETPKKKEDTPKKKEDTPKKKEDTPKKDDAPKLVCLVCERNVPEAEAAAHSHGDGAPAVLSRKGDVVVKCCVCRALLPDRVALEAHHGAVHPDTRMNYAFHKLQLDSREILCCGHCTNTFKYLRDLRSHHNAVHSGFHMKYSTLTPAVVEAEERPEKRRPDAALGPGPSVKRVARKSTTKLPNRTVARKSTTKLPFGAPEDSDSDEEYSYYGLRPAPAEQYADVTTLMPFCNTMMPFTLKKLSEIINIKPKVLVKNINK